MWLRFSYREEGRDFSYSLINAQLLEEPSPRPDEPSFFIQFCMCFTSSSADVNGRKKISLDNVREARLPDYVTNRLFGDVCDFTKTIEADPVNARKRVIPILVLIDANTIQMKNESVDCLLNRAHKLDNFYDEWQVNMKLVEEFLEEDTINVWIKNEKIDVDDCSICINCKDSMVKGIRLPCSHVYHASCILKWIMKNQTCPLCRSPVFSPTIQSLCRN